MIRSGRILFCDSLDRVKQSHRRLTLQFEQPRISAPQLAGVLTWDGGGREWTAVYAGASEDLPEVARGLGARLVEQASLSLDEIFVARAMGATGAEMSVNGNGGPA
jgi:ABC-2 type transport system ATP-binding protein